LIQDISINVVLGPQYCGPATSRFGVRATSALGGADIQGPVASTLFDDGFPSIIASVRSTIAIV
jgi:hypothetical protein